MGPFMSRYGEGPRARRQGTPCLLPPVCVPSRPAAPAPPTVNWAAQRPGKRSDKERLLGSLHGEPSQSPWRAGWRGRSLQPTAQATPTGRVPAIVVRCSSRSKPS